MGHELVQHVEPRQLVEDPDKAGPRVALIGDEEQPGVVFDALPPWRPALGGEIDAVVVGIDAAQDFGTAICRRSRKPNMRALGDERVAVPVVGEIEPVELVPAAERRSENLRRPIAAS